MCTTHENKKKGNALSPPPLPSLHLNHQRLMSVVTMRNTSNTPLFFPCVPFDSTSDPVSVTKSERHAPRKTRVITMDTAMKGVGGTSPFGTRRQMPVYCEAGIAALPQIYINGGKRGYILSLATADALRVLSPTLVAMAS